MGYLVNLNVSGNKVKHSLTKRSKLHCSLFETIECMQYKIRSFTVPILSWIRDFVGKKFEFLLILFLIIFSADIVGLEPGFLRANLTF